jgi:predicted O-methyltransferase YrrM
LRRRAARARSLDELLDLAYGFDFLGLDIAPGQMREEIRGLLEIVRARGCTRILEIGTSAGGTLFLLAQLASPGGLVISIDLPRGEFGGGYPLWKVPLYKAFARPGERLELIRGDSHEPANAMRVRRLLEEKPLDFLFIDGDHSYDGVRRDFEIFAPLVRPGGLVAFHDISAPGEDSESQGTRLDEDQPTLLVGDVPKFWNDIKRHYRTEELVSSGSEGFFGIGLVFL